ncbi:uncharacterized protein LOC131018861 [Salvia miltiorrhiza]|uniref:uncharacterized protein LOC131018861 n=1 Tax=Salvia miltiorrhiza TaxID=226208 RepID=UPI0025AC855B|nr:uncharacterized protein LOC131018861 [Salvia miltiorrhiza]
MAPKANEARHKFYSGDTSGPKDHSSSSSSYKDDTQNLRGADKSDKGSGENGDMSGQSMNMDESREQEGVALIGEGEGDGRGSEHLMNMDESGEQEGDGGGEKVVGVTGLEKKVTGNRKETSWKRRARSFRESAAGRGGRGGRGGKGWNGERGGIAPVGFERGRRKGKASRGNESEQDEGRMSGSKKRMGSYGLEVDSETPPCKIPCQTTDDDLATTVVAQ